MTNMKKTKRRSYLVPPEFIIRMKKTQGKIKAQTGREPSLTDLAEEMIHLPEFEDIEKRIVERMSKNDPFNIKFDKEII